MLIIGLNTRASIRQLKGEGRPLQTFADRAYALDDWLQTNSCLISSIIPFDGNHFALAEFLKPDVVIRGWDQAEGGVPFGMQIVRIGKGPEVSTTSLLEEKE